MDAIIGEKQREEMKKMVEETSRFDRITIDFQASSDFPDLPPSKRSLKPVKLFSELQAAVETYYPQFVVVLVKPGTTEIVGSQDELMFAYQDVKDQTVLNLELKIYRPSSKRKFPEIPEPPLFRHEGPWSNGEVELFKMGVNQYGWKIWKRIAGVINTRDREQVRKFAASPRGSQFKRTMSVTPGLLDLAEGLKILAYSLQTSQEQESSPGQEISEKQESPEKTSQEN
jgi:hypothetical protein